MEIGQQAYFGNNNIETGEIIGYPVIIESFDSINNTVSCILPFKKYTSLGEIIRISFNCDNLFSNRKIFLNSIL